MKKDRLKKKKKEIKTTSPHPPNQTGKPKRKTKPIKQKATTATKSPIVSKVMEKLSLKIDQTRKRTVEVKSPGNP